MGQPLHSKLLHRVFLPEVETDSIMAISIFMYIWYGKYLNLRMHHCNSLLCQTFVFKRTLHIILYKIRYKLLLSSLGTSSTITRITNIENTVIPKLVFIYICVRCSSILLAFSKNHDFWYYRLNN